MRFQQAFWSCIFSIFRNKGWKEIDSEIVSPATKNLFLNTNRNRPHTRWTIGVETWFQGQFLLPWVESGQQKQHPPYRTCDVKMLTLKRTHLNAVGWRHGAYTCVLRNKPACAHATPMRTNHFVGSISNCSDPPKTHTNRPVWWFDVVVWVTLGHETCPRSRSRLPTMPLAWL